MESRKYVFIETGIVAIGLAICVAVMLGIFAILNQFDTGVLLGGIVGGVVAIGYYLSIVVCVSIAAKKAQAQDIKGGQALMQMSYILRILVVFGVLLLCAISGVFNILSLVLPMLFVRPVLAVTNIILRKGESKA